MSFLLISFAEFITLSIVIFFLLKKYASSEVSLYVKVLTGSSWMISFGYLFILPNDIYYVSGNTNYLDFGLRNSLALRLLLYNVEFPLLDEYHPIIVTQSK
jgi:hypothetical protein